MLRGKQTFQNIAIAFGDFKDQLWSFQELVVLKRNCPSNDDFDFSKLFNYYSKRPEKVYEFSLLRRAIFFLFFFFVDKSAQEKRQSL